MYQRRPGTIHWWRFAIAALLALGAWACSSTNEQPGRVLFALERTAPRQYAYHIGQSTLWLDAAQGGAPLRWYWKEANLLAQVAADTTWQAYTWGCYVGTARQPLRVAMPLAQNAQWQIDAQQIAATFAPDSAAGLRFEHRLVLAEADSSLTFSLTVHNLADTARHIALFQRWRLPKNGLALWPAGDTLRGLYQPWEKHLEANTLGINTFLFQANDSSRWRTAYRDVREGWLAYTEGTAMLLASFTDVPASQLCPGRGEVELSLAPEYVQWQLNGPYASIPPQGKALWQVKYFVKPVAGGALAHGRAPALAAQVRALLFGKPNIITP